MISGKQKEKQLVYTQDGLLQCRYPGLCHHLQPSVCGPPGHCFLHRQLAHHPREEGQDQRKLCRRAALRTYICIYCARSPPCDGRAVVPKPVRGALVVLLYLVYVTAPPRTHTHTHAHTHTRSQPHTLRRWIICLAPSSFHRQRLGVTLWLFFAFLLPISVRI